MKPIIRILIVFAILVNMAFASTQNSNTEIRRYAIIAAANNGGKDRTPLRYAETDAQMVAKVLRELGGLDDRNQILLNNPSPDDLLGAFTRLQQRVESEKNQNKRSEVFFYYSGHSDDKGLLLGNKQLDYGRLKKALTGLSVDVQIAVLDSCASGAFTRIKGGTHKPPFLVDESSDVKGYAFLTSSSADESAQESDAIRGSYFTHYFVSALRGAGDSTQDKRVTLNEAYQYAFHETLARTEQSMSGAQHAAYDFKLAGAGDLVLTDLNSSASKITIEKDLTGRFYIRDDSGRLVLELNKVSNVAMDVSLPPQSYSVTLDKQGELYRGSILVSNEQPALLKFAQFRRVDREVSVARGDNAASETNTIADDIKNNRLENFEVIPFRFSLASGIEFPEKKVSEKPELVRVNLEFVGSRTSNANTAIGIFASTIEGNVVGGQGAGLVTTTGGDLIGGQGSGLVNVVRGNITGGQGVGGVNVALGNVGGGQGAGGVNIVRGNIVGGQGAGGVNVALGDVGGGQGAGGVNVALGNIIGGQGAGGVNVALGDVGGGQGSGGVNVARGNVVGGQGTGGVNIALGNVGGGQGSGGVNIALGDVGGVQGTAGVNIAGGTVGIAQLGTVNLANKTKYLQLGMVNLAKENDGVAFGLVNLIKNGRIDIGVSADEAGYSNVFIKTGAKYLYNHLAIGRDYADTNSMTRVRWGFGWTANLSERVALDNELTWSQRQADSDITVNSSNKISCTLCAHRSVQMSLGSALTVKVASNLRVLAGLSLNTYYNYGTDLSKKETVFGKDVAWFKIGSKPIRPGFQLGIQY